VKSVLILSREYDPHVSPVAEEIRARGADVLFFNLADFPEEVVLQTTLDTSQDGWSGSITYKDQQVALESLVSVWWRRPKQYKAPERYSIGERAFLEEEANRGIVGVLESLSLQQALWVSRSHSIRRAELKPLQLAAAQQLGLSVPRTLLTNDPSSVREFYDACQGNIILKAVSRGAIEDEQEKLFIYASKVRPEHLSLLEGVRTTTHLFQQYIPKKFDLRVIVIGCQVFAAELRPKYGAYTETDFRQEYDKLSYEVQQLPEEIKTKVLALVRSFGLQFSSMDFLVTEQGEYLFIDLNPNGQWFWVQLRLPDRLLLKEAMADLLVYPEEYRL
jgi:glutathione synthase/RimK-type ligase-like ATP-grasp enzyme